MPSFLKSKTLFSGFLVICFALSACDDPSTVGIGLVEAQAGDPESQTIAATLTDETGLADMTGGTTSAGALRALFGKVDDPVAGEFSMTGYMDFTPSSDIGSAFRATNVEYAALMLDLDYVYGDTTSFITVDIMEIDQAWDATGTRADTIVVARTLVGSHSFVPEPGIIEIPLPSDWVSENDTVLRSEDFTNDFHGFSLVVTQGNAIAGAHFSDTELKVSSVPGDTVSFPMSKVLSSSVTASEPSSSNRLIVRDGSSSAPSFRWAIGASDLGQAAIHRAIVRFNVEDVSGLYPTGFNRPGLSQVGLRAVAVDDETRLNILVSTVTDGLLSFESDALANIIQSANLGDSGLDRFELYIPDESSTVDFLTLIASSPLTAAPRAVITLTPVN